MRGSGLAVLAIFSTATACGGAAPENNGGGDLAGAIADLSGGPSPSDLAQTMGAYPAGPYGNTVGATIAPLVWEGYVDDLADAVATSKPYVPYTMDDLRGSGRAYAIVHVSDFY